MANRKAKVPEPVENNAESTDLEVEGPELVPEGQLVCALTGEQRPAIPQRNPSIFY